MALTQICMPYIFMSELHKTDGNALSSLLTAAEIVTVAAYRQLRHT